MQMDEEHSCWLLYLTNEVLVHIVQFLRPDLRTPMLFCTCKRLKQLGDTQHVWRLLYRRWFREDLEWLTTSDCEEILEAKSPSDGTIDWKKLCHITANEHFHHLRNVSIASSNFDDAKDTLAETRPKRVTRYALKTVQQVSITVTTITTIIAIIVTIVTITPHY